MHLDDMKAAQRAIVAEGALGCALGILLALAHLWVWPVGVLGFVLIVLRAGQLRTAGRGFDRVQLFSALCVGCKLVYMALTGTNAAVVPHMALSVCQTLLIYALWQAFGHLCADGNGIGRAALCASLLYAAVTIAGNVLGFAGDLLPGLYLAVHSMALGFEALAAVLMAVCLFVKRRKCKENTI